MTMTVLEQETMYSIQELARRVEKIEKENPTLRDKFAMEALSICNDNLTPKGVAIRAYAIADAMLEERNKSND